MLGDIEQMSRKIKKLFLFDYKWMWRYMQIIVSFLHDK